MHLYSILKFLHILAVTVFVGGIFARQLIRRTAAKNAEIQSVASLIRAARRIDAVMVGPGSMAAAVLGVNVALLGGVPITGFLQGGSENWLLASNILLIGVIVLVPAIFLPWGRRMEPILRSALVQGAVTPELRDALEDRRVSLAHRIEEIAILLIVALMVLKPF
ncbi:MAG: DUF2269 family protein [Bacteroidota bacterium]